MKNSTVFNKIIALINRAGIVSPVTIHLKDDGMIRGIPTGVNIQNNKAYFDVLDETTDRTTRIPADQIMDVSE